MRKYLVLVVFLAAGHWAWASDFPVLYEVDALEVVLQIRRVDDHTLALFEDGQEFYRMSLDEWLTRARMLMGLEELRSADEAYREVLKSGKKTGVKNAKRHLSATRRKLAVQERYYSQVRDALTGRKPCAPSSIWEAEGELRAAVAVFPFKISAVEKNAHAVVNAAGEVFRVQMETAPQAKKAELLAIAQKETDAEIEKVAVFAEEMGRELEILRRRAGISVRD